MSRTPMVPRHAVDRPLLRAQLDAALDGPLALLVAPAGSGKSVLLAQWAQSRTDLSIVWFDITPADDDPLAFAARLAAQVGAAAPPMRPLVAPVETKSGGLGPAFLEELAAELSELGEIVLIFDDLHHLAGSEILKELWRLVDLLPANAHVIFASRADLQLGWSRHRLEHALIEVRQSQLAFDADVTAQVLTSIIGESVSSETAESVLERTEGWAAGVQLSALSLRVHPNRARFADALRGTDRLVADYLSEVVLDAQPSSRREALIRLSVLSEITPGLAEAVAGVPEGATFMAELERDSMFVVPNPDVPGSYRFHQLFRDLLRYRLRASDVSEQKLLIAAAQWHLQRGETGAAADCLIEAADWDAAMEVLLTVGREAYERVQTTTVARRLSLIPPEVRATNTAVELLYAITVGMGGRAAVSVDILNALLEGDRLDEGQRLVALAYLAIAVQFQPHPDRYLAAARQAIEELDQNPAVEPPDLMGLTNRSILRFMSAVALGRAHLFLGEQIEARAALLSALTDAELVYAPYRVHALGTLAIVEALEGRLTLAAEIADEALDLARQFGVLAHPAPADAYLARALIAIQRGQAESGALALHEGAGRAAGNQRTQLMWVAYLAATLIDPGSVATTLAEPPGPPPPVIRRHLLTVALRRARLEGRTAATVRAQKKWSGVAFEEIAALLTHGATARARERIQAIGYEPRITAPLAAIEREIALGWVEANDGRMDRAQLHLVTAMTLAEKEWLVHPFFRAGPRVADLIAKLPGELSTFQQTIIAGARSARERQAEDLMEPLTARELDVLAYLPSRMTNSELAARNFVTVNTIKTHLTHIYRKLDVTSRDAAIVRAGELGLLPTDHTGSNRR